MAISSQQGSMLGSMGGAGLGMLLTPYLGPFGPMLGSMLGGFGGGFLGGKDKTMEALLTAQGQASRSSSNPHLSPYSSMSLDPSLNIRTNKTALDMGAGSSLSMNPYFAAGLPAPTTTGEASSGGFGEYLKKNAIPLGVLGGATAMQFFGPESAQEKYQRSLIAAIQGSGKYSERDRTEMLAKVRNQVRGYGMERGQERFGRSPVSVFTEQDVLSRAAADFDRAKLQQLMALAQAGASAPQDQGLGQLAGLAMQLIMSGKGMGLFGGGGASASSRPA